MKYSVALAQLVSKSNFQENIIRATDVIKKAKKANAKLIIFPEFFMTGIDVLTTSESREKAAEETSLSLSAFRTIAKDYSIDIIPGTFIDRVGDKLSNTTYYINSNGKLKARYDKINLSPLEAKFFSAGKESVVVDTEFGKVGLAICYDLFNPEHARDLTRKGAQIMACPSFWPNGSAKLGLSYDKNYSAKSIDALTIARAFENGMYVLFCNSSGNFQMGGNTYKLLGRTQITAPFKGVISRVGNNTDLILTSELDMQLLEDAEKVYGTRAKLE